MSSDLLNEAKLPAIVLLSLLFVLMVIGILIYFAIGAHRPGFAIGILVIMAFLAIALTILYLWKGVITVEEKRVMVVERLGQFHAVYGAGVHILLPFIDRPRKLQVRDVNGEFIQVEDIDLRERTVDLPAQVVITKDNWQVEVDSVAQYQIVDPKQAVYGTANVTLAMEELIKTSLRDVIGGFTLQDLLGGREKINAELKQRISRTSADWGVQVREVGLQRIIPPSAYIESMSKKQAAIAEAEGKKQAAIAEAEGKKQAAILEAEGERAKINAYESTDVLLRIKYLEALGRIANGNATKVFIPFPNDPNQANLFSNIMNIVAGVGEAFSTKDFNTPAGGQGSKSPSEGTTKPSMNKPESTKLDPQKPGQRPVIKRPVPPPSPQSPPRTES
jgi:regulator of protease activity HflC (stomatin/prohibitin superfamily)